MHKIGQLFIYDDLVPALVWMLGHGMLIGLTLWDVNWDDIALAQLTRRYKAYYDAG